MVETSRREMRFLHLEHVSSYTFGLARIVCKNCAVIFSHQLRNKDDDRQTTNSLRLSFLIYLFFVFRLTRMTSTAFSFLISLC